MIPGGGGGGFQRFLLVFVLAGVIAATQQAGGRVDELLGDVVLAVDGGVGVEQIRKDGDRRQAGRDCVHGCGRQDPDADVGPPARVTFTFNGDQISH